MLKLVLQILEQNATKCYTYNCREHSALIFDGVEKNPQKLSGLQPLHRGVWFPNNFLQLGLFPWWRASEPKTLLPNSLQNDHFEP